MKGGHTPGPWMATRTDPAEGYDCWWITACPAPNQEKEIATVAGGFPRERHEANARLIAAAPELLNACEALLERYRIMVAADGPECLQAIAVIAKARGTSCDCGDSAMVGNECKSCGARAEA